MTQISIDERIWKPKDFGIGMATNHDINDDMDFNDDCNMDELLK